MIFDEPRTKNPKLPVVLLIDTSKSMQGNAINELNTALMAFKEEILGDPILANRLEVSIVAFDDDARVERGFDLITTESNFPTLVAAGQTNIVAGINKAIEVLEARKAFYKTNVEAFYRPFIVLFTAGAHTNTEQEIEELDQRIQKLSDEKKFIFMPFGVDGADMPLLAKLAAQTGDERLKNRGKAYKLKDISHFTDIFIIDDFDEPTYII